MLYHILQSSKVSERSKLTKLGRQKNLKRYLESHVKLNKEVDNIASMIEAKIPEAEMKMVAVNKTKNIIHNRINKAGSTSMMGKNFIVKPKSKYQPQRNFEFGKIVHINKPQVPGCHGGVPSLNIQLGFKWAMLNYQGLTHSTASLVFSLSSSVRGAVSEEPVPDGWSRPASAEILLPGPAAGPGQAAVWPVQRARHVHQARGDRGFNIKWRSLVDT